MTLMFEDIVNDKCDISLFTQIEIIPIYKANKKLDPKLCEA